VILATVDDAMQGGFTLGAADYLLKPFDYTALEQTLWRHMKQESLGQILLVDDNQQIREILREQLTQQGYKVVEAEHGRAALRQLNQTPLPDLILLDLMMPEMDGFEFLLHLRQNPHWVDLPVIVISVMDLSARERQRLNGSVERIMRKGSFDRDELIGQIHHLLHHRFHLDGS
jgi:CheY-like chemotaxis protein